MHASCSVTRSPVRRCWFIGQCWIWETTTHVSRAAKKVWRLVSYWLWMMDTIDYGCKCAWWAFFEPLILPVLKDFGSWTRVPQSYERKTYKDVFLCNASILQWWMVVRSIAERLPPSGPGAGVVPSMMLRARHQRTWRNVLSVDSKLLISKICFCRYHGISVHTLHQSIRADMSLRSWELSNILLSTITVVSSHDLHQIHPPGHETSAYPLLTAGHVLSLDFW